MCNGDISLRCCDISLMLGGLAWAWDHTISCSLANPGDLLDLFEFTDTGGPGIMGTDVCKYLRLGCCDAQSAGRVTESVLCCE